MPVCCQCVGMSMVGVSMCVCVCVFVSVHVCGSVVGSSCLQLDPKMVMLFLGMTQTGNA